jgi:S-adenosylmethionine synthetase
LKELIENNFDLRPAAIIKEFDLRNLPKKNGWGIFQENCILWTLW